MPEEKVLRCKMRVSQVYQSIDALGKVESEEVTLIAVTGSKDTENAQWARWTPSANFKITINNPQAFNTLSKGHEFFVDFVPAPEP